MTNCTGYILQVISSDEDKDKSKWKKVQQQGKAYNPDVRRKCYVCGKKTSWCCVLCRFYFCRTTDTKNSDDNLMYIEGILHIQDSTCK